MNFRLFLENDLKFLQDKHPWLSIFLWDDPAKGIITLHQLQAKKDAPQGTGTAFMNDLIAWADKNNRIIVLSLGNKQKARKNDMFKATSSTDRLKKFYARFGFVSSYAKRSYRPDLGSTMHRHPISGGNG